MIPLRQDGRRAGAAEGCDLLIFRLGLKWLGKDRSLVALDSSYTAPTQFIRARPRHRLYGVRYNPPVAWNPTPIAVNNDNGNNKVSSSALPGRSKPG